MKIQNVVYPGTPSASMDCYLLDCDLKWGQSTARPAIIICAGGGYLYRSPRESEPVALAYAAQGFHTFLLNYSVAKEAAGWAPLKQLDWAIGFLREKADEWNINPHQIITCGFSAGGHLTLASGVRAENKPNAMVLCYPCTTFGNDPSNILIKLLAGSENPSPEQLQAFSLTDQVTADTPPAFIFTTYGDALTKRQTLELALRYEELQIPCEYHLFGFGPHGYSLANEAAADGSSQVLDPHAAKWFDLSVEWLKQLFGPLEFKDVSTSRIAKELEKLGISAKGAEHA